ncbi:MAG TPA: hypothetical protein VNA25_30880 [Phycisphaerae bacterium]|nr:hypothetical protein [Phycisphaerae bacterium]HUT62265.1 hypothetical protein [Phycisphaerae bacterium]
MTAARATLLLTALTLLGASTASAEPNEPPAARRVVADGQSWCPVFSPDGKSIAYLTLNDEQTVVRLGVAAEGAEPKVIADLITPTGKKLTSRLWRSMYCFPYLRWAPDGKSVYFLLQRERRIQCGAVSVADGKITPFGEIDKPKFYYPRQFAFGPDGRLLVSFVHRGEGAPGWRPELAPCEGAPLAIFDPAGGKPVQRTDGPYRRFWLMPDGNAILAATPTELWRLNADCKREKMLIRFEDPEDIRRVHFAGGRIILVVRRNPNKTIGDYSLLAGGALKPIRSTSMAFDQMIALPDGRLLWGQPPGRGDLTLQMATWEGDAPKFEDIDFDATGLAKLDKFHLSPDGRRVVAMVTPTPQQAARGPVIMGYGIGGMHPLSMNPKLTKNLLLLDIGKAGIAVQRLPLPGAGNLLLTEQDAVAFSPDSRAVALVRTLVNHLGYNADATRLDLMPCEFLARGEIWKIDLLK